MAIAYGQHIEGTTAAGTPLRAAVFEERQVRAAAGLLLVLGAIAFFYALLDQDYVLLRIVSVFMLVEFAIRVTAGIHRSPAGLVARLLTRRYPPEWVSAKPKRFAWFIGVGIAGAMTVITNAGITGYLPRTLCIICLVFLWLESVLGFCVGCEIHAFLVRRGMATADPAYEVCAGGVCAVPGAPSVVADLPAIPAPALAEGAAAGTGPASSP
ncbi:MAG: DUF4395 domain-containing protein [Thermoleophilia bacterium]